jgi:hypothetical protein
VKFAAKASADFDIAPAGNHVAICNAIVDIGMQPGRGQYPAPKHEVYLRFELPTERVKYNKDGKEIEAPMSIGRTFTASMSEKANIRKFIESWFGKKFPTDEIAADFDFKALLGRKCLLNVTHTEKGPKVYANINAATPIPKGMTADYPQVNKSLYFDLTAPDQVAYQQLPEWLRKKIDGRLTEDKAQAGEDDYGAQLANRGSNGGGEFDDDIPF